MDLYAYISRHKFQLYLAFKILQNLASIIAIEFNFLQTPKHTYSSEASLLNSPPGLPSGTSHAPYHSGLSAALRFLHTHLSRTTLVTLCIYILFCI